MVIGSPAIAPRFREIANTLNVPSGLAPLEVFRMADRKIAEWWVTWDNMTILRALGHLPSD